MNQYTRYLTVAILILQAPTYLVNLHAQLACISIHSYRDIFYSSHL